MKNKIFIVALGVVTIFAGAFVYFKNEFRQQPSANYSADVGTQEASQSFRVTPEDQNVLIKPHSVTKGATSAQVTVVEFLDPECESCRAMYPFVKRIFDEYKSEIRFVVRYMAYHKNSTYVANILEGTRAENKYWEALELLFETQDQWANHQNPNPDLIPEILRPLNLNMNKIIADAKAGKYDALVMEDMEDGKKVGVRGTPTFFVNGHQVQELGYESLKNEIESRLVRR